MVPTYARTTLLLVTQTMYVFVVFYITQTLTLTTQATNRIDSLDPALIRPGRIDRKIEFPLPDIKTKRRIFQIHTGKMTLADDVNMEEFVTSKDDLSGADVKAVCTEAGLLALRERRMRVTQTDFRKAKEKVLYKKKEGVPEGLYM